MQFMKLSVLLFRFQMLLFHPVLWLPKVFGFPRLLVSNVMGFPKLLWFSKGVLGLRQRAFSGRFSFLIGFAFPVEIVRSCSLEESRHRSAKHWYGITLFRSFLWLLQRLFRNQTIRSNMLRQRFWRCLICAGTEFAKIGFAFGLIYYFPFYAGFPYPTFTGVARLRFLW